MRTGKKNVATKLYNKGNFLTSGYGLGFGKEEVGLRQFAF